MGTLKKALLILTIASLAIAAAMGFSAYQNWRERQSLQQQWVTTGSIYSSQFADVIIDWVINYVVENFLRGVTSSVVGEAEKQLQGEKELQIAEANTESGLNTMDRAHKAVDTYGQGLVDRTCRVLEEEIGQRQAAIMTSVETKTVTAALSNEVRRAKSANELAQNVLDRHADKYCSYEDTVIGRCSTMGSMPNADIMASTLLQPSSGETFSAEQKQAAMDFIRVITTSTSPERLPPGLEKTPAGRKYLVELQQAHALTNMAQQGLVKILAARSPNN